MQSGFARRNIAGVDDDRARFCQKLLGILTFAVFHRFQEVIAVRKLRHGGRRNDTAGDWQDEPSRRNEKKCLFQQNLSHNYVHYPCILRLSRPCLASL